MRSVVKRRAATTVAGLFVALGAALAMSSPAVAGGDGGGKGYSAKDRPCATAAAKVKYRPMMAYGYRPVVAYGYRPVVAYGYRPVIYGTPYGGYSSFSISYNAVY